jgi:uncharacterized protein (TIGR02231 family)
MAAPQAESLQLFATAADGAAPQAEIERLTAHFSVTPPAPVGVPAFEQRRIQILSHDSELAFWSVITPAVDSTAFLHGAGTLDTPLPLLPGEAVFMVEGQHVGRTRIGYLEPGEAVEFGFGANPAIVAEYKVLKHSGQDRGVFDKVRVRSRNYATTVTNRMDVAHEVRLRESVPVSRDEAITVRLEQPQEAEVDPETGAFERALQLAPGEERTLATRFEVRSPREWELPGGY